jgi:hypothetical protein
LCPLYIGWLERASTLLALSNCKASQHSSRQASKKQSTPTEGTCRQVDQRQKGTTERQWRHITANIALSEAASTAGRVYGWAGGWVGGPNSQVDDGWLGGQVEGLCRDLQRGQTREAAAPLPSLPPSRPLCPPCPRMLKCCQPQQVRTDRRLHLRGGHSPNPHTDACCCFNCWMDGWVGGRVGGWAFKQPGRQASRGVAGWAGGGLVQGPAERANKGSSSTPPHPPSFPPFVPPLPPHVEMLPAPTGSDRQAPTPERRPLT